jgi:hypothetical protein
MTFLTSPVSVLACIMDPHCPVFSAACRMHPFSTFVYPYQHRNVSLLCSTLFLQIWCKNDSSAVTEVECLYVGSLMLFTKYKTVTLVMPWVCLIKYESIMYISLFIVLLSFLYFWVFLVQKYSTPNIGNKIKL